MEISRRPLDRSIEEIGPPRRKVRLVLGETVSYAIGRFATLFIMVILMVLIGEAWTRLPWTPQSIQYVYDEELGHRYAPNQIASSRLLGLYGIDSPSIHIDGRGFRNANFDWSEPVVLALGSSEVLGPGNAEEDIWTSKLSDSLSQAESRKVIVYNAGTAAYGPYHSAVVLQRFLEDHLSPALVIVRVSLTDSDFIQPTREQLLEEKERKAQRDLIKRYTVFASFLYAKLKLQVESLKRLQSFVWQGMTAKDGYSVQAAEAMWAANKDHWSRIASLAMDQKIPVLFVIADPYGTAGGAWLSDALQENVAYDSCVIVWRYATEPFSLYQQDLRERQRVFKERYMLSHDEHANALQHQIIATELGRYVQRNNLLSPQNLGVARLASNQTRASSQASRLRTSSR